MRQLHISDVCSPDLVDEPYRLAHQHVRVLLELALGRPGRLELLAGTLEPKTLINEPHTLLRGIWKALSSQVIAHLPVPEGRVFHIGAQNRINEPELLAGLPSGPAGWLPVLACLPPVVAAARHLKEHALLAYRQTDAAREGDSGAFLIYKFVKASSVRLSFFFIISIIRSFLPRSLWTSSSLWLASSRSFWAFLSSLLKPPSTRICFHLHTWLGYTPFAAATSWRVFPLSIASFATFLLEGL